MCAIVKWLAFIQGIVRLNASVGLQILREAFERVGMPEYNFVVEICDSNIRRTHGPNTPNAFLGNVFFDFCSLLRTVLRVLLPKRIWLHEKTSVYCFVAMGVHSVICQNLPVVHIVTLYNRTNCHYCFV